MLMVSLSRLGMKLLNSKEALILILDFVDLATHLKIFLVEMYGFVFNSFEFALSISLVSFFDQLLFFFSLHIISPYYLHLTPIW